MSNISLFFHSPKQGFENEAYHLTLAVDCVLTLADLMASPSNAVNRFSSQIDHHNKPNIPSLTLLHIEFLLERLLRQTFLALFPTLAREKIGDNASADREHSENSSSINHPSSDLLNSSMSISEVDWLQVHETEAPLVRFWWTSVSRRLPADAIFSTIGNVNRMSGVSSVRAQIQDLLHSAEDFSQYALGLRLLAETECRQVAQMSASIIGMLFIEKIDVAYKLKILEGALLCCPVYFRKHV